MSNESPMMPTDRKMTGLGTAPQGCSALPSVDFLRGASKDDPGRACHASQYPCALHGMHAGKPMYMRLLAVASVLGDRMAVSTGKRGVHV